MVNRRNFVRLGSAATAITLTGRAGAAEPLQRLPTDNPQAVALNYVEDVEATPPDAFPADSGQNCANCLHFKSLDDSWGSCALFPTFKVTAAGLCVGWVKQS
jgi:hypothetical protein